MPNGYKPDRHVAGTLSETAAQRPRGGGLVFAIVFLAVAIGIAAIVLFANDKEHLRSAFRALDLEWPFARVENSMKPPIALKGKRVKAYPVKIPERFLAPPEISVMGGFMREMRRLGPAFCATFDRAGISNAGWLPSQFDSTTYECISETVIAAEEDPAMNASFFFIAKGDAEGGINSIRMKLVAPETEAGRSAHAQMLVGIAVLIEQTGWSDLEPAFESVRQFTDYSVARFGLSLQFAREFTDPHRFNLIILPTNKDPAIKRSRFYFDPANWFRAAENLNAMPRLKMPTLD